MRKQSFNFLEMLCRVGDDAFPFYYSDNAELTWGAPLEKELFISPNLRKQPFTFLEMLNTHGRAVNRVTLLRSCIIRSTYVWL
jgi:hypothetical protein